MPRREVHLQIFGAILKLHPAVARVAKVINTLLVQYSTVTSLETSSLVSGCSSTSALQPFIQIKADYPITNKVTVSHPPRQTNELLRMVHERDTDHPRGPH